MADAAALAKSMTRDPVHAGAAHGWLGRVAISEARFSDATEHFGRARDLGAQISDIAEHWSRALAKIGRAREACDILDEAASSEPERGQLRYLAGNCLLALGDAGRARPHLHAARGYGVRHAAATMALARALFATGGEDRAVDLLAERVAEATSPEVLLEIGKLLFRNVLYHHATDPLRRAWEAVPLWYDAGMYLALAHYQLEDYEECARILSALDQASRPAEFRYLLGSSLAQLGQTQAARRELDRGISLDPGRAGGYLNLGLFLLDQGLMDEAVSVLEQGARLDATGAKVFYRPGSLHNCRGLHPEPDSGEGDPARARYFVDFADALLAGQQWGAALAVYRAALTIDPRSARPYGAIGLVCQELGSADVGMEFAKRGVELHPDDPDLRYYLGTLQEFVSEPGLAIESYRAALRLGGTALAAPRYWLRLGMAQVAAADPESAERSFRAAVEMDAGMAEAYLQMGKLRLRDGKHAEAEALFEKAVRLDPNLPEAEYSWGLALVRNGKREEGRTVLEAHRRKAALRRGHEGGMP